MWGVRTFALLLAAAFVSGASDPVPTKVAPRYQDGSCCDKALKKGEKCLHPCCVKAAKAGKVCDHCNEPAKK